MKKTTGRPDPMVPDLREERLVSWAKGTIDSLRCRVESLTESLQAASAEHAGSEVALRQFRGGGFEDVPLPAGSKIRFKLADPDFPEKYCEADVWIESSKTSGRPQGRLVVNLNSGAINIVPCVSNQIYIDSRRY